VFVGCKRDVLRVTVDMTGTAASSSVLYTASSDIVGEMMSDLTGSYLVLTTATDVVLLDASTGSELWSQSVVAVGSAIIGLSNVYVQTSSNTVCSFEISTGNALPCATIPEKIVSSSPLVDASGNMFVCGSTKLYLISGSTIQKDIAVNGCRDFILSAVDEIIVLDSSNTLLRIDSGSTPMNIVDNVYISSGPVNAIARAEITAGTKIKKLYLSQDNGVTVVDSDDFASVLHHRSSQAVKDAAALTSATDFIFASQNRLIGVPVNEPGNPTVYFQEAASGQTPVYDYESRPLLLTKQVVFALSKGSGHGLVYTECNILRSDETPQDGVDYCPNIVYDPSVADNFGLIIAGAAAVLLIPAGLYSCKKSGVIKCKSL